MAEIYIPSSFQANVFAKKEIEWLESLELYPGHSKGEDPFLLHDISAQKKKEIHGSSELSEQRDKLIEETPFYLGWDVDIWDLQSQKIWQMELPKQMQYDLDLNQVQ